MKYVETLTVGGRPTTPGRAVPSRAKQEAEFEKQEKAVAEYQKAHRIRMEAAARVLGLPNDIAKVCADWWCERFYVEEKRDAFRTALIEILMTGKIDGDDLMSTANDPPKVRLEVDYDPNRTLLAALSSAGIECRGFLFSAGGIIAQKRRMYINGGTGEVRVIDGYGAQPELLDTRRLA